MSIRLALGNNTDGDFGVTHSNSPIKNSPLQVKNTIQSASFTATSLSDSDVGVAFYIQDLPTAPTGTWTVKLMENNVMVRSYDIDIAAYMDERQMIVVKWDTPFQYTSLTADYYNYELSCSSTSSANEVMQDNNDASKFAYVGFKNGSTLVNNDTLYIPLGVTTLVGSNSLTLGGAGNAIGRTDYTWQGAIRCSGIFSFDDSTDSDITINGSIVIEGSGQLGDDTEKTKEHTLNFNLVDSIILVRYAGKIKLKGIDRGADLADYVSGNQPSSTGNLFISDDIGIVTGDTIRVTASSDFDESEYIDITGGDFASGYTTSSDFVNVHTTDAKIFIVSRSININATTGMDVIFEDNSRMEDNYIQGVSFFQLDSLKIDSINLKNCAILSPENVTHGIRYEKTTGIIQDTIFILTPNMNSSTDAGLALESDMITVTGCIFNSMLVNSIENAGNSNDITNSSFIDNNTNNSGVAGNIIGKGSISFTDCLFRANQRQHIKIRDNFDIILKDCSFGTGLKADSSFNMVAELMFHIACQDCSFEDNALGVNMQSGLLGSFIKFQDCVLPGFTSDNECLTYETNGILQKCGAGLADTTNKTTGNHTYALKPNLNGVLKWSMKQYTKLDEVEVFFAYFKAVNFNAWNDTKINLYLPNETTPITLDIEKSSDWLSQIISGHYTGSSVGFSKIEIEVETDESTAVLYITDIMNGTNDITGLNLWENAQPSSIMFADAFSPMEVWGALTSIGVPDGSYGKLIVDNLDAKISDVGGMSESDLHTGLDNYTNKDDYKATTTIASNMRGTDNAITSLTGIATKADQDLILADTNELQTNQGNWATATGFATTSDIISARDNINANVDNIPTNPLLTNDTRLDNLDATISSRSIFNSTSDEVITDTASRNASKADISLLALETTSQHIKDKVDLNLDMKISDITTTIDEDDFHNNLDSYSNKDDYKATTTIASNMRGTDNAITSLTGIATSINVIDARDNINANVDNIPTNPLLTNDVRLNNIDATISSRSTFDNTSDEVITNDASRIASRANVSLLALESTLQLIKTKVDLNLDAKISDIEGMSESDLHIGLDNYTNKDDYKVNITDIPNAVWTYKRG